MSEPIWTMQQVANLNAWQHAGHVHPFTCGHRSDHPAVDGDKGILVATRHGWICPYCDYTQDWAHAEMLEGPGEPTFKPDPFVKAEAILQAGAEPFFILRAQDLSAPAVVREWVRLNQPSAPELKIESAEQVAYAMSRWAGHHKNAD